MSKTKVFPICSKYGTFCGDKVLDARDAKYNRQMNENCCNCMIGGICLPLSPVMGVLDIISYPFRLAKNSCKKN